MIRMEKKRKRATVKLERAQRQAKKKNHGKEEERLEVSDKTRTPSKSDAKEKTEVSSPFPNKWLLPLKAIELLNAGWAEEIDPRLSEYK